MSQVSDIIYPESHLDSPIVAGKLVSILFATELEHNQYLHDTTLIRNLKANYAKNRNRLFYQVQRNFKSYLTERVTNLRNFTHIPYPYGNSELFKLIDNEFSDVLHSLHSLSFLCFKKISHNIIDLINKIEEKMGVFIGHQSTKNDDCYPYHSYKIKDNIVNLPGIWQASRWYKPFLFWFTLKTEMRHLRKENIRFNTSNHDFRGITSHESSDLYLQLNKNLVAICDKANKKVYYLTEEMLLLYCDVVEGRLMTDIAMTVDPRYYSLKKRVHNLWDLIDSFFKILGNETYEIVGLIEPLTLAILQCRDATSFLRGTFLDHCLHELSRILYDNGYRQQNENQLVIDSLLKIMMSKDIHIVSEFFSFFRSFGHPILEAGKAADKVREYMNKPKLVKFQTIMKGHALFCGMIINGFREKHSGVWPPCSFPNHCAKKLIMCKNNNESLTHDICIENWKSFVGFKFSCFMSLTLDEDLTMYMKDKALAAIKSEWDSVYPDYLLNYPPSKQTTSRRLVETFLKDENFDPINLINYVLSGDYLKDDEFNLSYSLKEKEIKQVGRLFAKMTYKMRACQVVAESLIATGIGKYFKENGMVKNEHDLLKALHKLSISSVPKNYKIGGKPEGVANKIDYNTVPHYGYKFKKSFPNKIHKVSDTNLQYETVSSFLTTDLQKFCLNWRAETTNIFAERLNEIYGLPNFFNWLHKRLEKSVLYVADPHCPPYNSEKLKLDAVENKHIFIKYPMGGPEGYSQKLWTIVTIPFLYLSAYQSKCKIAAIVQGDNQAIAITRKVHPNLTYQQKKRESAILAREYFSNLRSIMADIGHNLKANETIISSHFFVYSKRIYYDGLCLSQCLKPISRCVFWSETLVDETRSACSNISTAISKSIEQGYDKWGGYSINLLKTLQQIIISLKFTINPSITADITEPIINNPTWLLNATVIPAQLGGFNYMNIARLYVRNIGDPITASLADLKRLIKSHIIPENTLQKIMTQECGHSSFLDWASDPYSINIPNSQSVTTLLKNITSRTILQNSNNPMLQGLFHFECEQEDRDLADFLMNRSVIMPRAAHEILDRSLTGARQEIAGMLDSTKGLIKNSIMAGGVRYNLLIRLNTYDYEQFRIFNNLMLNKQYNDLINCDMCSLSLAIQLRKRMWKHLTYGRPIYGLEVPDIIEVCQGYFVGNCEDCYYCECGSHNYGWFFTPANSQLDSVNLESNSLRIPYFGSTTDERSEIKLGYVKTSSKALKAAIRIATVYTWAYGDSDESWHEAWFLASMRANISLDELKTITPISTSNNIAHRLRDKSTQMKYSGSTLNRVSRYTTISNDKLNFMFNDKKVDTNLVYQQVMLLGLSVLEQKFRYLSNTGLFNTVYHLHTIENCCIVEMQEHPLTIAINQLPTLTTVCHNRLVYDDNPIYEIDKVRLQNQNKNIGLLDFPRWTLRQLNKSLSQSLASTLVEILNRENKDHLNEFKVIGGDDDINSLITEFMLVDPKEFSSSFGLCLLIQWAYDLYYRRPEGKYQILEMVDMLLNTTSKDILKVIANALSHPTVFDRFWVSGLIEPIFGPNISCQNFNKTVIQLITNCITIFLNQLLDKENFEFIITESEPDIIDQRVEVCQARYKSIQSMCYLQQSQMIHIRGMTSIEKYNALKYNIEDISKQLDMSHVWNIQDLNIINYPTSLTYLRRGAIKYIRLQPEHNNIAKNEKELYSNSIYQSIINNPNLPILGSDQGCVYFPAIQLFSQHFSHGLNTLVFKESINKWEKHVSRRVGINSTSCYKALEITNYIRSKLITNNYRLFLGEGSGSMMTTYYFSLGKALNYYNSGVLNSETIGQRVLNIMPSELYLVDRNSPLDVDIKKDLIVLFNGKPESTWIGKLESFAYISNKISKHSLDFVHNDMESSIEKDSMTIFQEQIHSLCLAVNLGSQDSIYVTKLIPRQCDPTFEVISIINDYYDEVFCFIPESSNPFSSEIYIICTGKKPSCIITPDIILKKFKNHEFLNDSKVQNCILGIKLKNYMDYKRNNYYYSDYVNSNLNRPTHKEEILISFGFTFNGHKVVKELVSHDTGSGKEELKSSIKTLLCLILNLENESHEDFTFLDPYPLQQGSKIREMLWMLAKKMTAYYILYGFEDNIKKRKREINNLRNKILIIDLGSSEIKCFVQSYFLSLLKKSKIRKVWIFEISTKDIKKWWKLVGFSLLLK
ncbi:polymerase [Parajeilongvirus diaemi]|nr:polymerase [Diaemus bat paramyxovirus]